MFSFITMGNFEGLMILTSAYSDSVKSSNLQIRFHTFYVAKTPDLGNTLGGKNGNTEISWD